MKAIRRPLTVLCALCFCDSFKAIESVGSVVVWVRAGTGAQSVRRWLGRGRRARKVRVRRKAEGGPRQHTGRDRRQRRATETDGTDYSVYGQSGCLAMRIMTDRERQETETQTTLRHRQLQRLCYTFFAYRIRPTQVPHSLLQSSLSQPLSPLSSSQLDGSFSRPKTAAAKVPHHPRQRRRSPVQHRGNLLSTCCSIVHHRTAILSSDATPALIALQLVSQRLLR